MDSVNWTDERLRLQTILEDIQAGKIVLKRGEAEYVAQLRESIADLDRKLSGPVSRSS